MICPTRTKSHSKHINKNKKSLNIYSFPKYSVFNGWKSKKIQWQNHIKLEWHFVYDNWSNTLYDVSGHDIPLVNGQDVGLLGSKYIYIQVKQSGTMTVECILWNQNQTRL